MIKKIFVFIQSDGWYNTFQFIMNGIWGILGRKSITLCLVCKKTDLKIPDMKRWNQFVSKTYTSFKEFKDMDFPRLKYTPYRKWLNAGAICRVIFNGNIPVAFSWIHYNEHSIEKVGTFDMGNSTAWLGPYFVHKKYRGLALQQLMIVQDILEAPKGITSFITSVNQKNVASLRSFLKSGFFIGGSCTFLHRETDVDIKDEASLYLKIKR